MTEGSDLYGKIAEKYGLRMEQVREAVIYFWRTGVKRNLELMVSNEIYIPKLGSFKIKDYKLKYVIPHSYNLSIRPDLHERTAEYLTALNKNLIEVQKLIKEREDRYNEFLKQHPEYLPKSQTDLGRSSEQDNQEGRS